jgi:1-acyl-sn-glycerol-3-phosphate acyltransferase
MTLFLRSLLFHLYFAVLSAVMNIGGLPLLLLPRKIVMRAGQAWAQALLLGLKLTTGLGYEVRGAIPKGPVLIAAKHFTMWETVAFQAFFPDPAIVIKRELLGIPFYGWYCRKMGMIAIDRNAHMKALRQLLKDAKDAAALNRPIVIFPEGTRRQFGAPPDYKPGAAALYTGLNLPCVPVALNANLYWQGFLRRPGTVVMEFLEPIPPGLKRDAFMALLQTRIEEATARLVEEGAAKPAT